MRNGQKIKAVFDNAEFVIDVAKEHGGFGKYLTAWPEDDQAGLMAELHKRGSRMGGTTAQYFLRFIGWDAWITSGDVSAALVREGVWEKPAATKTAFRLAGEAFNGWHEQSGQPRAVISRTLALSVG